MTLQGKEPGLSKTIMQLIQELSHEREKLMAREGAHHGSQEDHRRIDEINHDLGVLWDLRRRELAGESVDPDEDFFDRYDRYTGRDSPGR
jgi:hypothetical protein